MRSTRANWLPQKDGVIAIPRVALMIVLSGILILTMSRPLMLMTDAMSHAEGVKLRQWGYATLIIIGLIAAYIDGSFSRKIPVPSVLLPLIMWSAISITWSTAPEASIRRFVLTVLVLLTMFITVDRVGPRKSIITGQIILLVFLIASIVVVILFPYFGIQNYNDVDRHWWRGVMANKNIAGMSTALTVLFFSLYGSKGTRLFRYAIAFIAAVFLYYTESSTSTIGAVISFAVGAAVIFAFPRAFRSGHRQFSVKKANLVLLCVLCVLTASLTFLVWEGTWILDLSRNPDLLTGRGKIWQPMIISFLRSPFLGSGYGAFWDAGLGGDVAKAGPLAGVTQGHNGYLDLAVQIGVPGLVLALGALVMWPMVLIARLGSSAYQLCSLAAAVLTFFVINNMTESSIFDGDQVLQVFVTLIIASLVTALRRLGQRRSVRGATELSLIRRSSEYSKSASLSIKEQEEGFLKTEDSPMVVRRKRVKPIKFGQ